MSSREGGGGHHGRIPITLACTICNARNYKTTKSRRDGAPPLKLKKFCKTCNLHTIHEETR